VIVKGGYPYYGEAIGILMFDDRRYPMIPGNVGNASTYDFPVRLKVVRGLNWYPPPEDEWGDPPPAEVNLLVQAAKELESEGVRAIVTCCGFFSVMQETLAKAVDVPVFTSPLILLPLLLRTIAPSKSIAVYTASRSHLTEGFIRAGGVAEAGRVKLFGAEGSSEFCATHMGGTRTEIDFELMQQQIVDIAAGFAEDNPDLGMILLECTTFPSFSVDIQQRTGLPVVDYIDMINFVYDSVVCRRYNGFT
jgi:hypothetical protein